MVTKTAAGARADENHVAALDGTLFALDGPAFLELVGGGGAIRGRLMNLYATPEG